MKKLIPLILTLTTVFTLSACGNKKPITIREPNNQSDPTIQTTPLETKTPETKALVQGNGLVEYSLMTSQKKISVGESFIVNVLMNTKTETVVSGQVYLSFDQEVFDVEEISTKDSDFSLWLDKTYLDTVRLTFADQAGVKKTEAKVATLKLKAKKAGSSDISFVADQTIASKVEGGNVLNTKKLGNISLNVK